MTTFGIGQRIGIMAGSGVGKSPKQVAIFRASRAPIASRVVQAPFEHNHGEQIGAGAS